MFKGAELTPYNYSWEYENNKSADYDLIKNETLTTLRSKSRQLVKDNPLVSGLVQTMVTNIVGAGPEIYCLSSSGVQQKQIDRCLENFHKVADVTKQFSFTQVLEALVTSSCSDGDILISLPLSEANEDGVETTIELIEAHRIRTPTNIDILNKSYLVRNGVQHKTDGSVEGYWVIKADKVDIGAGRKEDFDFYPVYRESGGYKRKVTHLFRGISSARPFSSRQYPLVVPLINLLKMLDDLNEAILIGARVAACFSAFINVNDPVAGRKSMTADQLTGEQNVHTDGNKYTKLRPGSIYYLNKGEAITFADPNKPSDNTDSLTLRTHKTIAMAMRIPYIILFLDTEEASYSSWRGAVIESFKYAKRWHRDLNSVIDWIIKTVIAELIIKDLVRSPATADIKIIKRWQPIGILDPEKEGRANKIELTNGTKSKQIICDEQGIDYDEVLADREKEALDEVELQAKILVKRKELSEKYDIVFEEDQATVDAELDRSADAERDTSKTRRPGEKKTGKIDEEDAKERRKSDGNY
jgi:lambda family phage portal protein